MELTIDEIVGRLLTLSSKLDHEMRFEEAQSLTQAVAWIMTKRRELSRLEHPVFVEPSLVTREMLTMAEFQADVARKAMDLL